MYKLYVEKREEQEIPCREVGSSSLYQKVFCDDFNFSFECPSTDTCEVCEEFISKIGEAIDDAERIDLETERSKHLEDAGNRYELKREDKEYGRIPSNITKVIMLDLEICLLTPYLSNSQSFYYLKLWTYNLTIHGSSTMKSYCVTWNESVAGKGGNEVASGLMKWVEEVLSRRC